MLQDPDQKLPRRTCVQETRALPSTNRHHQPTSATLHAPYDTPLNTVHPCTVTHPIHTPVAALSSAPPCPFAELTSNNNLPSNDAHRSRWSGRGSQLWLSSTFSRAAAYGAWVGTGLLLRVSLPIASHMAFKGSLWSAHSLPRQPLTT